MKYYKIPKAVAERLNVTDTAVKHPDGWYLILAPVAARLSVMVLSDEGLHLSADEAVTHCGGVVYSEAEALCSQRGEEEYMMNREEPEEGLEADE